MSGQLSQEDQEWLSQPVNVDVPPDDSRWLSGMLEMKREELISYAFFQYQVPKAAAEASSREELVQLIVMANKAGGGGSVLRQRYSYLRGLPTEIAPVVAKRGDRPLYLTRGKADSMHVYDSRNDRWLAVNDLRAQFRPGPDNEPVGLTPSDAVATGPITTGTTSQELDNETHTGSSVGQDVDPATHELLKSVIESGLFEKANRPQLEQLAAGVGIEDPGNPDLFATNNDLKAAIKQKAGFED